MQPLTASVILFTSVLLACDDDPIINTQKEIPWVVAAPSDPDAPPPWPFSKIFPLVFPAGTFTGPFDALDPVSLAAQERDLNTEAALAYLLKIRTIDNAKHFDKSIQFLIAQVCGNKPNVKIPLDEFYPMQSVHEVRYVGCGLFKLPNNQRVCGNYLKKQKLCEDVPALPHRQR